LFFIVESSVWDALKQYIRKKFGRIHVKPVYRCIKKYKYSYSLIRLSRAVLTIGKSEWIYVIFANNGGQAWIRCWETQGGRVDGFLSKSPDLNIKKIPTKRTGLECSVAWIASRLSNLRRRAELIIEYPNWRNQRASGVDFSTALVGGGENRK
jgi:hypothetical protein